MLRLISIAYSISELPDRYPFLILNPSEFLSQDMLANKITYMFMTLEALLVVTQNSAMGEPEEIIPCTAGGFL